MNLSELSIPEINMRAARIQYPDANLAPAVLGDAVVVCTGDDLPFNVDYCGDDALAFRLMVDMHNKEIIVATDNLGCVVVCMNPHKEGKSTSTNPNRAIAECYILMSEGVGK